MGLPARMDGATTREGEGPKAPPVGGPASTNELTDALGVFVAADGQSDAPGTRAQPMPSIQAAIDLGKRVGKRVYVCAGTYHEAIVIGDSISIIGGLDCSRGDWRTSDARTRIEAPTSPALRANNIVSPTRIEGLDVVAPNATTPSSSSIGLLATRARALVVARSTITAGNAANGEDGSEGVQLSTSATAGGGPALTAAECAHGSTCTFVTAAQRWIKQPGGAPGTNACDGAPDHEAQPGGTGGSGGLWQPALNGNTHYFRPYLADASYTAEGGVERTSANGTDAADGANAAPVGALSGEGYVPANGVAGADGAPGYGGKGGSGRTPEPTIDPSQAGIITTWRGWSGTGGGAGGCPGLAGTPGTGGGASIAAMLVESPMKFEASELVSARGGDAGRGTFGSSPTSGGNAGYFLGYPGLELLIGKPGGRGGAAGTSSNGGSGPSLGIAHTGSAPTTDSATRITAGTGGAAIDARSRTDALRITKTIPATPAGTAQAILAL